MKKQAEYAEYAKIYTIKYADSMQSIHNAQQNMQKIAIKYADNTQKQANKYANNMQKYGNKYANKYTNKCA